MVCGVCAVVVLWCGVHGVVVGCGLWIVGCGLWVVCCVLCVVCCVLADRQLEVLHDNPPNSRVQVVVRPTTQSDSR